MKKFATLLLPLVLLSSCLQGGSAPFRVDLNGDLAPDASTYMEAMVRRDGTSLVNELKSGDSALVFFGSATCSHCEAVEANLCSAIRDAGLLVNLVYLESSYEVNDPTSDYYVAAHYLRERYGDPDLGRYTPWLYYVTSEEARTVYEGGKGENSYEYFYRLLSSNFSGNGVTRYVSSAPEGKDKLQVLLSSRDEEAYSSYLQEIKSRASQNKEVAFYDLDSLKEEGLLPGILSSWGLKQEENAVRVGGVAYRFPSEEASKAIEGYFA